MSDPGWLHVPIGPHAARWTSRPQLRVVLVVAHSVTALQRLLDVTSLFRNDARVQVVFTRAPNVFSNGVDELLRDLGAIVIPWQQAMHTDFDLAIASGYSGLYDLRAPVIVFPHGSGYNKFSPRRDTSNPHAPAPLFGLSSQFLLRDGEVIPAKIVLTHTDDVQTLKENCPEAIPSALVAGDPIVDRLHESRQLRDVFREKIGIGAAKKLLLISSTWGPDSLFGTTIEVFDQALEELDQERYVVTAILHPNIWFGHGVWQVRQWLQKYTEAGLVLLDPGNNWRHLLDYWQALLICADWVIGDHGSVTLYSIAAGVPVLQAKPQPGTVIPGSAMELLQSVAPVFTVGEPLRDQLAKASTIWIPNLSRRITERMTSHLGTSAEVLRSVIYDYLRIPDPHFPASFGKVELPNASLLV